MKPRIRSLVWEDVNTRARERTWHVSFVDSCGCPEGEDFPSWATALRFARHIAGGGSRWEFVA